MDPIKNLRDILTENYISLEVWTACLKKKEFRLYIENLKNNLKKQMPEISYLQTKFTRYIKDFEQQGGLSLLGGIYGCKIKINLKIDWFNLKQNCMDLEKNNNQRVADIDVFIPNENGGIKISRKRKDNFCD